MLGKFARLDAGGTSLVLTRDGLPQTHALAVHVKVTLNGKPASLRDLKVGDDLELDGQPVVAIKATRTKP